MAQLIFVTLSVLTSLATGYFLKQSYESFSEVKSKRDLASLSQGHGLEEQPTHESSAENPAQSANGEHGAAPAEGGHGAPAAPAEGGHGASAEAKTTEGAEGEHNLKIREVFVNLNSPERDPHYMKLVVRMELFDQSDSKYVGKMRVGLKHKMIELARTKNYEEMKSMVGLLYFKEQLTETFNSFLNKPAIKQVDFEDFYLQ